MPTTILETIARIDGALILDNDSNLLAFGAILHYPDLAELHPENIEGGRALRRNCRLAFRESSKDQ